MKSVTNLLDEYMLLTYHSNKDRIRRDGNSLEASLRIPLLNRVPVQVRIFRPSVLVS
jgi:hypothetical protein